MSFSSVRKSTASLAALTMLLIAAPAAADAAQEIFDKGVADCDVGRDEAACSAFLKSYRLEKRPVALFRLAECEEKAGRVATAALHYDEYLDLFERRDAARWPVADDGLLIEV